MISKQPPRAAPAKSAFLRLTGTACFPARLKGAVVAIGNFDGAHKGHEAVLRTALNEAAKRGKPALVFTFEPHPRSLFAPDSPVYRLTTAEQKAEHFKAMGFAGVIEQNFTPAFAGLSAEDFISQIICRDIRASCVVAGENFHFGHKRQGTPDFLREAGKTHGFVTLLVGGQADSATGALISSSRIRSLLEQGDIGEASRLLGHPYAVSGEIIHGQALGRKLGFPTANIALPPYVKLKFGIYAVCFRVDGALYHGVASFGRRPTVEQDGKPLLEVYIFNFSGDIYGKQADVLFFGFLRGEEKFRDMDALIAQMRIDAEKAEQLLSKTAADIA